MRRRRPSLGEDEGSHESRGHLDVIHPTEAGPLTHLNQSGAVRIVGNGRLQVSVLLPERREKGVSERGGRWRGERAGGRGNGGRT